MSLQQYGQPNGPNQLSSLTATAELQRLLTIPPPHMMNQHHHANNNPIMIAHAVLEHLQNIGDPDHLFLRTAIEIMTPTITPNFDTKNLTQYEELLFHCIIGCRQVLLWKWQQSYSIQFKLCLRDYFMISGNLLSTISRTCRMACYLTSVSFWKRSWVYDDDNEQNHDTTSLQQQQTEQQQESEKLLLRMMYLCLSEQQQKQQQQQIQNRLPIFASRNDLLTYFMTTIYNNDTLIQTSLYIDCMISEFSNKSAINYKLPIEFHKMAHRLFEKKYDTLIQCLQISINGLEQIFINTNKYHMDCMEAVIKCTTNIMSWEFGLSAWDGGIIGISTLLSSRTVIRPPVEWRVVPIIQPDFCRAIFTIHNQILHQSSVVAHAIRQLLILLASITGAIYETKEQRLLFMTTLCEGTVHWIQLQNQQQQLENKNIAETNRLLLVDTYQIFSRLIANFRLGTLMETSNNSIMISLLQGFTSTGCQILQNYLKDCAINSGDYDAIVLYEYYENIVSMLLECCVLLCTDPFLVLYYHSSNWNNHSNMSPPQDEEDVMRKNVHNTLSTIVVGPLYENLIHCRIRIMTLHEQYSIESQEEDDSERQGNTNDEGREEIEENDLDEEMSSIATLGRCNLLVAISCLANLFHQTVPQLCSLWDEPNTTDQIIAPHVGGILEQTRLIILSIGHLLTDRHVSESPSIPDTILVACQEQETSTNEITSIIQSLMMLANIQLQKVGQNPSHMRLSPLLGKTILWFFTRWVAAYIYPVDYCNTSSLSVSSQNRIVREWSHRQKASNAIQFCITICFQYQCYWPLEKQVQELVSKLCMTLAKRSGPIRSIMVSLPIFQQMVRYLCLTIGIRHNVSQQEFESTIRNRVMNTNNAINMDVVQSMDMIRGYHRLSYSNKARILTAILIACSDIDNANAKTMFNESFEAVHDAFNQYTTALSSMQSRTNETRIQHVVTDDLDAREMACLCMEMFGGIARTSEMSHSERIPQFVTRYLSQISILMKYYSKDLAICELILNFFRDYTEHYISSLDHQQCLELFRSSADVLRLYSTNHCTERIIVSKNIASKTETDINEEKSYNDILCAVQILINLGTKDFIDSCDTSGNRVPTNQVTEIIFFGLQQILPLMTQGLLQYPTLCKQFFDLVSFMMDTYPDKVCTLPNNLFEALTESLLFGMSHHNPDVAKCSLQGLTSIAKEHLASRVLQPYLMEHPHLFDTWSRRLLIEVVFQSLVVDRLEAASMALLPIVAIDVSRFAAVVQEISTHVETDAQRDRLNKAFGNLIQPDVLSAVNATGYEGRKTRIKFKNDFEIFVNDVHSFLVMR